MNDDMESNTGFKSFRGFDTIGNGMREINTISGSNNEGSGT